MRYMILTKGASYVIFDTLYETEIGPIISELENAEMICDYLNKTHI